MRNNLFESSLRLIKWEVVYPMNPEREEEISRLLNQWRSGDQEALRRLLPLGMVNYILRKWSSNSAAFRSPRLPPCSLGRFFDALEQMTSTGHIPHCRCAVIRR